VAREEIAAGAAANRSAAEREHALRRREPAGDVVEFRSVTKTYDGESFAVRDLGLVVRRGEFLTFLGPSGSGKTTSLLLLAGFETPTSGDILVDGRSIARTPPHKRNIGMVFQNYALFPHLSVLDNVAFPLSVRGTPKAAAHREAERVLDLVRMTGLLERRPHQLSGGQQQRTALARALVFNPSIVLMDEPFGALDKKLRERMQIEVKQIHRDLGNTMISVTHDQSEALTMSDRIAVFNNGTVHQVATPDDIYLRPSDLFVANFVGETNVVDVDVEARSGDDWIVRTATGERIVASASWREAAIGRKAVLVLRPERIAVSLAGAAYPNRFEASVRDLIYSGDHVRCLLEMFGRNDWSAKLNDPGAAAGIAPGAAVQVCWNAKDSLLFAANGQ
jgi:putative spermidine/putrescine transport system ATP-binding protein